MDFPIQNGESFHSYVSLPEGNGDISWYLGGILTEYYSSGIPGEYDWNIDGMLINYHLLPSGKLT